MDDVNISRMIILHFIETDRQTVHGSGSLLTITNWGISDTRLEDSSLSLTGCLVMLVGIFSPHKPLPSNRQDFTPVRVNSFLISELAWEASRHRQDYIIQCLPWGFILSGQWEVVRMRDFTLERINIHDHHQEFCSIILIIACTISLLLIVLKFKSLKSIILFKSIFFSAIITNLPAMQPDNGDCYSNNITMKSKRCQNYYLIIRKFEINTTKL